MPVQLFVPLAAGGLLGLLAACGPVDPRTGQADAMPIAPPSRSSTVYTDSLSCLDQLMVSASPMQQTLRTIGVGVLPDATGKVSPGLRDMVTTALVRATRNSHAFFPEEVMTLGQAPLGNAGSPIQTSGSIITLKPGPNRPNSLQVHGALSQADRNVGGQSVQAGIGFAQNLFGISQNSDMSNVGIDLHLTNVDTRLIQQSVSNQMTVRNRSRGANADFKIERFGFNVEISLDEREGLHQAVRTLVELSVLELLGEQTKVPYWKCLQLDQRNPAVRRQIASWYRNLEPQAADDYARRRLRVLGYSVPDAPADMRPTLGLFQRTKGLIADGALNFDTFAALVDSDSVVVATGVLPTPPPPPEPKGPRRLRLDVQEVAFPKPILQLTVGLDRGGAVACWYRDEDGGIWRILPSRYQGTMQSADEPLRIPPQVVATRPVIQPERMTPTVGFLCATGERDWAGVVPPPLWGEDLKRLPQADFVQLTQALRAGGGGDATVTEITSQSGREAGRWAVVPPFPVGGR